MRLQVSSSVVNFASGHVLEYDCNWRTLGSGYDII